MSKSKASVIPPEPKPLREIFVKLGKKVVRGDQILTVSYVDSRKAWVARITEAAEPDPERRNVWVSEEFAKSLMKMLEERTVGIGEEDRE